MGHSKDNHKEQSKDHHREQAPGSGFNKECGHSNDHNVGHVAGTENHDHKNQMRECDHRKDHVPETGHHKEHILGTEKHVK